MSADNKNWRVYFNKFAEAPFLWSIDSGEGTPEHKFANVHIAGGEVRSGAAPENRGSEDKSCAWFEVFGELIFMGHTGFIVGKPVDR